MKPSPWFPLDKWEKDSCYDQTHGQKINQTIALLCFG